VISQVIVINNVGLDLGFKIAWRVIVLEQAPANAIAPISHGGEPSGWSIKAGSSRSAWSSSMRHGPSFDALVWMFSVIVARLTGSHQPVSRRTGGRFDNKTFEADPEHGPVL
jgi:hypothetical protein